MGLPEIGGSRQCHQAAFQLHHPIKTE